MKKKIIRDSVHGYIAIPEIYFDKFVDTEAFQRLRYIEQTSMRCLYPCARHDRFAHSIGTFYIGKMLINSLIQNLKELNSECYEAFSPKKWGEIARTFELACLLHDCAHAPFSHITEEYMDRPYDPDSGKAGLLVDLLCAEVGTYDVIFSDEDLLACCTTNHEKASALLLWRKYKDDFINLDADPILAMRMILGYSYSPANSIQETVLNCIFSLLNGAYMDADKLDYIIRDTASSGIDNYSVDLHRLIKSVTIVEYPDGMFKIGYLKTSISVIQNMISAKNNLYLWIYAHHKVLYYSNLLRTCFEKAVGILFGLDHKTEKHKILATCSHFISVDAMSSRTKVSSETHEEIIYLPCDADIMVLIKNAYHIKPDDPDFIEFFSRIYKKSVWKSYAEFKSLFKNTKPMYNNIVSNSAKIIESLCACFKDKKNLSQKECWTILNAKAKLSATKNAGIYVQFDKQNVEEYSNISNVESNELPAFFYLYYQGASLTAAEKQRVIKVIKSYAV